MKSDLNLQKEFFKVHNLNKNRKKERNISVMKDKYELDEFQVSIRTLKKKEMQRSILS